MATAATAEGWTKARDKRRDKQTDEVTAMQPFRLQICLRDIFWGGWGKIWTFSVSSLPFLSSFPNNMVFPLYIF